MSQSCQTVTANLGSVDSIPLGQGRLFQALGHVDRGISKSRRLCLSRLRQSVLTEAVRSLTEFSASVPLSALCMPVASMSAPGRPVGHTFGGLKVYPISLNSKEQLIITLS